MRLSIIVPVYNTEAYVAKCLDSLIEPDLGGYEIIAVNDGSTDSSGEVVRRYGERYPDLVKVVDTPNGGLSHARNVGIEASEADYLLFIDSDDYVSDRAVCEILQVLEQDMDIAVFDFVHVNESGEVTAPLTAPGGRKPLRWRSIRSFCSARTTQSTRSGSAVCLPNTASALRKACGMRIWRRARSFTRWRRGSCPFIRPGTAICRDRAPSPTTGAPQETTR
ncbi:MAG: glycosyltransferase family 2 protein [Oscillospiraceae bacterium]|nr:glycosyltransferase family 2 protein [Oscillospiraceae bacterium]